MSFRVLGFGFWSIRLGVQGLCFGVSGLGFIGFWSLVFGVELGFRVWGMGLGFGV